MKSISKIFLVIALLNLSACIEYKESMKLYFDGSGEIVFSVGLAEGFFNLDENAIPDDNFNEQKIKESYSGKRGVKLISTKSYTEDGIKWIEVNLEFETLYDLEQANIDTASNGMVGKFSLDKNENGDYVFTREIFNSNNKVEAADSSADEMLNMMFGNYKWKYELTLPSKIISANAPEKDIDRQNNKVKWAFNLASLAGNKTMTVTFEKESTANQYYIFAASIILIVLVLLSYYNSKRKRTIINKTN